MGTANSRAMAFNSNLNPFAGIKKEVANFGGNWGDWAESRMEGPLRVENKKTGQWDQVGELEWKDFLAGVIYLNELNETKPQLPPDSRQVEAELWQEATTVRERVWQIAVQTGKVFVLSMAVVMSAWSCFNPPGLSAGGQPNPDNPGGNSPENGNDGGEQDLCLPGMDVQINGASAKFTGVKSAFSVPESTLNNLNSDGGEPPVNNYLACAVNVEGQDYDYQSGGPILESTNGDKVMAVVRPLPLPERIGSFLAVFPNEPGMAVEHGGEVFRAAVMADFSRAQIGNDAGGLVMVLPEVIIDGDTGNAVDTGGGVILSVGADGSIILSIGGIRTTVINSDDAGEIFSLQQAVEKLQQVAAELAVSTHEGQNMANMRTTAGEPMNGNANKIGLSEQAVKVLNEHNYIVVSVAGGADNSNIVSWCEAGQCLVSPTPELFIPGGVLDAAAGVDDDGMVTFRMDDGSVQKGLVRLPQVEGASWVWVVEQVDGETPGKAWVALVKDSGGKSGQTPEILGKFQAIFADGVSVQINETENGFTLVITGADGSMIETQQINVAVDDQPEPNTDLTPEQSAQIAGLNEKWNGVLEIDPETFEITSKAGGGASVEGLEYIPETGKIKLTFYSDGLGRDFSQIIDPDFIVFGKYKDKPVNVKNIVKAFTIGENGQIERVVAIDDQGETKIQIHTPLELNTMIVEDHSTDPHWDDDTVERLDELSEIALTEGIRVLKNNGYYLRIQDLEIKLLGGNAWGWNNVYVWSDETQDFVLKKTSEYRMVTLDSAIYPGYEVTAVFWMGKNGLRVELVAGPAYINRMGHQYGEDAASLKLASYGFGE